MSSSSSSKHDDKKPVSQNLVPVSQKLVPFQNQNRFSPLTPTSKNSQLYSNILQSKLVTPKVTSTDTISPFAKPITPQTQKSVTPSPSTKTPYVLNPNFLRVQILEDFQIHKLHQGFHILTNHLFGQGKTFYVDSYKPENIIKLFCKNLVQSILFIVLILKRETLILAKLILSKSFLQKVGFQTFTLKNLL